MAKGCSREVFEQVRSLVKEEASSTPRVIMSTIVLVASKIFLSEYLLNEDDKEVLKGDKLRQVPSFVFS
jgi:hypothetical protein